MDTAYGVGTRPASAAARGCIYGMFLSAMGCGIPDQSALDRAVVSAALADVHRWSLYQVRVAERSVPSSRWFMSPGAPTVEILRAFLAFHGAGVVDSAIAVSLTRRNLTWVDLSRSVRLTRPVTWLDSAAVDRRLDAGILRRLFEGGCVVELSLPGYGADTTHAVLYAAERCAGFCSRGSFLVLGRDAGDKWRVERYVFLWIS